MTLFEDKIRSQAGCCFKSLRCNATFDFRETKNKSSERCHLWWIQPKFSFEIEKNSNISAQMKHLVLPLHWIGARFTCVETETWIRVGFFDDSYEWLSQLLIARTLGLRSGQRVLIIFCNLILITHTITHTHMYLFSI